MIPVIECTSLFAAFKIRSRSFLEVSAAIGPPISEITVIIGSRDDHRDHEADEVNKSRPKLIETMFKTSRVAVALLTMRVTRSLDENA